MSANAFRMRVQLARLAQRHCVAVAAPPILRLAAPCAVPIYIEGVAASATMTDSSRQRFAPFAFRDLPSFSWDPKPELRLRHGTERVGEILKLWHDKQGSLRIRARIEDAEAARYPALSVACEIHAFEILDEDSPENFRAVITRASLGQEISLTDRPCCSLALVDSREQPSAQDQFYQNAAAGVGKLMQVVDILRDLNARHTAPSPPQPPPAPLQRLQPRPKMKPKPKRLQVEPYRATQFGQFISELERRHEQPTDDRARAG